MSKTWWRVLFDPKGKPVSAIQCEAPSEGFSVEYVFAENQSSALSAAIREYSRRKTAAQRVKFREEGRCRCGRQRTSENMKCDTCLLRQRTYDKKRRKVIDGKCVRVPQEEPRNEKARIEKNLERQRDRRSEIRLEVLLQVRSAFKNAATVYVFGAWLADEISKALANDSPPEMTQEQREAHIISIADEIRDRLIQSEGSKRRVAR